MQDEQKALRTEMDEQKALSSFLKSEVGALRHDLAAETEVINALFRAGKHFK